jgi:hypothetical protein
VKRQVPHPPWADLVPALAKSSAPGSRAP